MCLRIKIFSENSFLARNKIALKFYGCIVGTYTNMSIATIGRYTYNKTARHKLELMIQRNAHVPPTDGSEEQQSIFN